MLKFIIDEPASISSDFPIYSKCYSFYFGNLTLCSQLLVHLQSDLTRPHVCSLSIVSLFKKYIMDNEGKETMNHVNLYLDIDAYYNIAEGTGAAAAKNTKQKKDIQASFIYKSVTS